MKRVFIDGEAGTTGLQILERLQTRHDLEVLSIDPELRKDAAERKRLINASEVTILCLPDAAAIEAAQMVENDDVIIIDASSAHRVSAGWTYGFPEMSSQQRDKIKTAKRISNPGCYPTGFIALVKPLVDAGVLPLHYPITVNAVSGYSGGGKSLISQFEDQSADAFTNEPYRIYGLSQTHKHLPEMRKHTGIVPPPMFSPSVGRYEKGMLVEVPLPLWSLGSGTTRKDIHQVLNDAYTRELFVRVPSLDVCDVMTKLTPEGLNGTNFLELFVFGSDEQARLVARLDNLGKGASGAAVQNLNLALGLPESSGL